MLTYLLLKKQYVHFVGNARRLIEFLSFDTKLEFWQKEFKAPRKVEISFVIYMNINAIPESVKVEKNFMWVVWIKSVQYSLQTNWNLIQETYKMRYINITYISYRQGFKGIIIP